jgi:hypothetical protein
MNLNKVEKEHLGNSNLDAFFSHLDFLLDNPEAIKDIPNNATVVYEDTLNPWVNSQNDKLAAIVAANGENVHRVKAIDKFSMTFPDGRKVVFNTDYLWNIKEASQITKLSINQIKFLEKEKAVVGFLLNEINKKDKHFEFRQIIQLQAYKLILKQKQKNKGFEQNTILKGAELKKILDFYGEYQLKVKQLDHFPLLFNGGIFIIAPDMSGSQEFMSNLATLDWKSESVRVASFYPPLLEVLKQLCENAWELTATQVWTQKELEEKLMMAA